MGEFSYLNIRLLIFSDTMCQCVQWKCIGHVSKCARVPQVYWQVLVNSACDMTDSFVAESLSQQKVNMPYFFTISIYFNNVKLSKLFICSNL